jgi:lysophospholipase L1-like esterase
MTRILVFGDSVVWGSEDLDCGGWADRFKLWFKRTGKFNEVFNLGNPGDNSEWLLERMEGECTARLEQEYRNRDAIIIQIGKNDLSIRKNAFMVSPEKFRENIQKLIELSGKHSSNIIFVGLTPINETKTNPIPWNTDVFYKGENIRKYNEIIKSVCAENKIRFIDIYEKFAKIDYKKLLEDGLHPNSEGHKMIFNIVKDFLIKERII